MKQEHRSPHMRLSLAALILLIAACTPPRIDAPPASQDKAATVGAAAPANAELESTNAAILSALPIDAVWSWNVDDSDGMALASLAYPLPPDRPPSPSRRGAVFAIICSPNDDSVFISLGHNIAAEIGR